MNNIDALARQMGEILTDLLDGGFELPIHCASVAVNGAMIFSRYTAAEEASGLVCDLLAQHTPSAVATLPINLMFVDANGEAAHVLIETPDSYQIVH